VLHVDADVNATDTERTVREDGFAHLNHPGRCGISMSNARRRTRAAEPDTTYRTAEALQHNAGRRSRCNLRFLQFAGFLWATKRAVAGAALLRWVVPTLPACGFPHLTEEG
jgi:hypothetical protein